MNGPVWTDEEGRWIDFEMQRDPARPAAPPPALKVGDHVAITMRVVAIDETVRMALLRPVGKREDTAEWYALADLTPPPAPENRRAID